MFDETIKKAYPTISTYLANAVRKAKLANCYTFIGKDNEDASLIASNIAKILNCTGNIHLDSSPCNSCTNCRWLEKKMHPEALIIVTPDAKSKKDQIKIDSIRELISTLQITSKYFRVIFFPESSLSLECSNLLLKTVEETPPKTLFIFFTNNIYEMQPTILSRSQIIHLTKKINSLQEVIVSRKKNDLEENVPLDIFSLTIKDAIEKSKSTIEFLDKKNIDLKNYISFIAAYNYEQYKDHDLKKFSSLYKALNSAYLKSRSFINNKIVIEDLFLECCPL